MRRDIKLLNSFTLEASLCGARIGPNKDMHFRQSDLELVGRRFAETLLDCADPEQAAVDVAKQELAQLVGDCSVGGTQGACDGVGQHSASLSKEERRGRRKGSKAKKKRRGLA